MSTRSFICKEEKDGKVVGVFCHWDGYPTHNGRILLQHYPYDEKEKVDTLINLGNLESLGETIETTRTWHQEGTAWEDCKPTEWESLEDCLIDAMKNIGIEYVYIYKHSVFAREDCWEWRCYDINRLRRLLPEMYTGM